MMRCPPSLAAIPLLFAIASAADATQAGADLRVSGSIVPGGSCAMKLGSGIVDFGTISRADLNPDPTLPTALGGRPADLVIECPTPTRYALLGFSPSAAGIEDDKDFGLLSEEDRSPVGSLYIRIDNYADKIDGVRAYHTAALASADLGSAEWGPSTFSPWPITRGTYAFGFVTQDGSRETPPPIRRLTTKLLIVPTIKPSGELDLTDEFSFTGDLGLELKYF